MSSTKPLANQGKIKQTSNHNQNQHYFFADNMEVCFIIPSSFFFFFFDQVHFQVMCFVVWADSVHMCLVYYQALIKTKVYKGIMSASRSKVFLAFILVLVYFSFGNLIFQTRPLACLYLHCSEPVRKKGWRSTTAENETRMCLERELCWYLKSLCLTYSPEGRCFISYSSMFCEYRCV